MGLPAFLAAVALVPITETSLSSSDERGADVPSSGLHASPELTVSALEAASRRAVERALEYLARRQAETLDGSFPRGLGGETREWAPVGVAALGALAVILCLGPKRSGDVYTPTDVALLSSVAHTVSLALERFDQAELTRDARKMEEALRRYNDTPGRVGDELPDPPRDIHEFWRGWATRGWFDWEHDGWPYWSHLSNVQSWWDYRELPNIQLVHFADMVEDTEREARRIAEFLEIAVPESDWPAHCISRRRHGKRARES